MAKEFIFLQMFDVRPRTKDGQLDLAKIEKIQRILDLRKKEIEKELFGELSEYENGRIINLADFFGRSVRKKIKTPQQEDEPMQAVAHDIVETVSEAEQIDHDSVREVDWPQEPEQISSEYNSIDRDYLLQKLEQIEQLQARIEFLKEEESVRSAEFIEPEEKKEPEEPGVDIAEDFLISSVRPVQQERQIEPELSQTAQAAEQAFLEPATFDSQELALPQKEILTSAQIKSDKPVRFWFRPLLSFGIICVLIFSVVPGLGLVRRGLAVKENVLSSSLQAYKNFFEAQESITSSDFSAAQTNFESAWQNFLSANQEIERLGKGVVAVFESIPGGSSVASGVALVDVGENLALAGRNLVQAAELFSNIDPGSFFAQGSLPLTEKIKKAGGFLKDSQDALLRAQNNFERVKINSLPQNIQEEVFLIKDKLPQMIKILDSSLDWAELSLEFFGHQKAKKYLLVFKNNSEMRPTGGFIGSYGVLDLSRGEIKNLYVGGIFDIDGQLYDKIIPPAPIQKISTAWSTHDANWFADWPTSAQKIAWFFERTGGPTVDGVIALTPTVMEKLLSLVGPIEMPAYGVTLTAENFVEVTQYKVEVDYDKEHDDPKKILADLAPLILNKLSDLSLKDMPGFLSVLGESLSEKHLLFYFNNERLQRKMELQGWAGKIEEAPRDYLNVINANINGFKTDRVIEQEINHSVEIKSDGSILDTLTIIRRHLGGNEKYDWWNRVNANYLRVYVPFGSKLISATGHTLESQKPPIDYKAHGFQPDPEVLLQENSIRIDPVSGTQIFTESGKTVFGNWVYTSPGESTKIVYQYELPFKLDLQKKGQDWSLLIQKQAGMTQSFLSVDIILPEGLKSSWRYPSKIFVSGQRLTFQENFDSDKFLGIIFNLD